MERISLKTQKPGPRALDTNPVGCEADGPDGGQRCQCVGHACLCANLISREAPLHFPPGVTPTIQSPHLPFPCPHSPPPRCGRRRPPHLEHACRRRGALLSLTLVSPIPPLFPCPVVHSSPTKSLALLFPTHQASLAWSRRTIGPDSAAASCPTAAVL